MVGLCPECQLELKVSGAARMKLLYDDTPDVLTEVYQVHDLICQNESCINYEKVVETVEHRMV